MHPCIASILFWGAVDSQCGASKDQIQVFSALVNGNDWDLTLKCMFL